MNSKRLMRLLQEPRGNPQKTLEFFRDTYFDQLTKLRPAVDLWGNWHLDIPLPTGEPSRTLFLAHTDTVDNDTVVGFKPLVTDKHHSFLALAEGAPIGLCLGADDGAGVEVLTCLAEAGIPGYYIWTAEEEVGCQGIRGLLIDSPAFGEQFSRAISFDRKGTTDIITHQMGRRGCSDEFATALAEALGMSHELSDRGTYTDSHEFMGSVPECTNIAVGYYNGHTPRESLDLVYLRALIEAALRVSWEDLPTSSLESLQLERFLYECPELVLEAAQSLGQPFVALLIESIQEVARDSYHLRTMWPQNF